MAIDFFEKEVSSAQRRFNETFGELPVCNLKLRQSVIVSICLMGRTGEKIQKSKNENEKKELIRKFMRIRNALNGRFTEIENHQKESPDQSFFLCFSPSSPHIPWLPPDFVKGKSREGPRGDLIALVDWCVGQILDALDKHNFRDFRPCWMKLAPQQQKLFAEPDANR